MSDEKEKKLKPLSPAMQRVANGVMNLRRCYADDMEPIDDKGVKSELYAAIEDATPELVAAGFNVFNTGPALLAIENCKSYAGALVVHYELDKLRRMLWLEKPQTLARGPGSGR